MEEVTLHQYSKSLQRVAVLRLLQQLSHVYSVMKIPALAELVPFMNFGEVEQIIVDAVKHDFLQASRLAQEPCRLMVLCKASALAQRPCCC